MNTPPAFEREFMGTLFASEWCAQHSLDYLARLNNGTFARVDVETLRSSVGTFDGTAPVTHEWPESVEDQDDLISDMLTLSDFGQVRQLLATGSVIDMARTTANLAEAE